jgi:hypothetical protein
MDGLFNRHKMAKDAIFGYIASLRKHNASDREELIEVVS